MPKARLAALNHLLVALPPAERALLLQQAQSVTLTQKQILCEVGGAFEHVYFLAGGAASVLTTMQDGASVEVGMVGAEGMTPVSALFGDERSAQHIFIQLPGEALRISVATCRAALEENAAIRHVFLRYANDFLQLAGRSAACNRLHTATQRMARWLLMSSDRYGADAMPLTQEYLALMLGVRRAGVTEIAIALQRAGLIRYTPGQITVVDRPGLGKIACECYVADLAAFARKP